MSPSTTTPDEIVAPAGHILDDADAAAYYRHPEHLGGPVATYDLSEATNQIVPQRELLLGILTIVLWTAFFCGGVFVPTMEYRQALWGGKLGLLAASGHLLVVVSCYTLTNIWLLCCAAALLGCMTRRWQVSDHSSIETTVVAISPVRVYLSALLRGFFLYLITVAGFLTVTTEESLISTKLDQYIRIAGVTSVLAFVVGYDPRILNRFLARVMDATDLAISPQRSDAVPDASTSSGRTFRRLP
jgi:hypothetical protein